ncbi:MAG TPA: zinc ribbon domain-containing protein, partial [Kofleriaceae bacterium]
MEGSSVGGSKCPKCAADVAAGETFCAACGASMVAGVERPMDIPPEVIGLGGERDARIGRARKWLLAISIITLVSGFIFYAIGKDEVEKQIREAEVQISGLDPTTRDELVKQETGMTWEEVKAHDRGQVNLLLFINI